MTDADIGAKVGLRWRMGPFEMINPARLGSGPADLVASNWSRPVPGIDPCPRIMARNRSRAGQPFDLKYVSLEKMEDDVGWITFNRPEALNALNPIVVGQLDECRRGRPTPTNPGFKAIVIQGRGKAFVAGADIGFFVKSLIKADRIKSRSTTSPPTARRFSTSWPGRRS